MSEEKDFLLRSVPKTLHNRWKFISTLIGCSMREFALDAIDTIIKEKEEENKDVLKEKDRLYKRIGGD